MTHRIYGISNYYLIRVILTFRAPGYKEYNSVTGELQVYLLQESFYGLIEGRVVEIIEIMGSVIEISRKIAK